MKTVGISQQWLRSAAAVGRTRASSRGVEPKHWHLAVRCASEREEAGPERGASIRRGGLHLTARKVPHSAPNQSDRDDHRNDRSHQGTEPVRFSNGQQQS